MNLTLQAFEANSPSGIDAAFVRMASDQAQALIILADSFMNGHVQKLADLSLKNRLPAIYGFREFGDAGGLLSMVRATNGSFGAPLRMWTRFSRAQTLPIEQPTTFELLINLKTAKVLGVTIPDKLLATTHPQPTK
jgi:putative ABC transport system substrate-binding protein